MITQGDIMKHWIKTSLVVALSTAAVLGGGMAVAHGQAGHAGHPVSIEQVKSRINEQVDLRLAKLELALALTSEQKPAWGDFKKAIKTGSDTVLKEIENRHKAGAPKTAIERVEREEAASKLRLSLLADAHKAIGTFYVKLNDAQKTVFDAEAVKLLQLAHTGGAPAGHDGHHGKGKVDGRGHGHGQQDQGKKAD
jgi:hypothetical protein